MTEAAPGGAEKPPGPTEQGVEELGRLVEHIVHNMEVCVQNFEVRRLLRPDLDASHHLAIRTTCEAAPVPWLISRCCILMLSTMRRRDLSA